MEKIKDYIDSLTKEGKQQLLKELREAQNSTPNMNAHDVFGYLFNYVYDSI